LLFKKNFLVVFFISAFSLSCTFEPLYSEKSLLEYEIIEPSKSNKELHEIYRNLNNLASINESDDSQYTVELEAQSRFDDIDVREDEKVMRMGVSTTVIFKIREKNSDKILFTGQSIGSNAFNRISEPYSNEIAKNDAVSKLSMTIAYDIRNQLALYSKKFKKWKENNKIFFQ